ncbi:MAG TPA: MATE family efflux transporter, partial [Candidatus Hydrogenedentes bacterium]|nr:MATE family efflux transporter [Candidatus Hydrogenedentota bacterium]
RAMRLTLCMLPIIGFQVVSSGYFQAVGRPRTSAVLMLSRQLFFLFPAVIILPRFMGITGIWLSIPFSDGVAALLAGTMISLELRRLHQSIQREDNADALPDAFDEEGLAESS